MHSHTHSFHSCPLTDFTRYNEVCNPGYNFQRGGSSSGTGHFTQVVWKDSVELGIGHAEVKVKGMLCTYTVGRYKPAGNLMNKVR